MLNAFAQLKNDVKVGFAVHMALADPLCREQHVERIAYLQSKPITTEDKIAHEVKQQVGGRDRTIAAQAEKIAALERQLEQANLKTKAVEQEKHLSECAIYTAIDHVVEAVHQNSNVRTIRERASEALDKHLPPQSDPWHGMTRQGLDEYLVPNGQTFERMLPHAGRSPDRGEFTVVFPKQLNEAERRELFKKTYMVPTPAGSADAASFHINQPTNVVIHPDASRLPEEWNTYFTRQLRSVGSTATVTFPRKTLYKREPTAKYRLPELIERMDRVHGPIGIYAPPGEEGQAVAFFKQSRMAQLGEARSY